jgi:hypothetical protein
LIVGDDKGMMSPKGFCLSQFIESHRRQAIESVLSTGTMVKVWPVWQAELRRLSNDFSDSSAVFRLGNHLSDVFKMTSTQQRGQSDLSSAGAAWECLICWYLNLVFSGSRAVAIKQKQSLVPSCVSDATTVMYGSNRTNTESDLVVLIYPDALQLPETEFAVTEADALLRKNISRAVIGIIQCKTNWNDNAQIPMLWDIVYRAQEFRDKGIKVGQNGVKVHDFAQFSYSFVTVPTTGKPIKPSSMAAKRVSNLSGGNYWGRPSENGVALSLCEIFDRNFRTAFSGNFEASIESAIQSKTGLFATAI